MPKGRHRRGRSRKVTGSSTESAPPPLAALPPTTPEPSDDEDFVLERDTPPRSSAFFPAKRSVAAAKARAARAASRQTPPTQHTPKRSLVNRLLELKARFDGGEIDVEAMVKLKREMMELELMEKAKSAAGPPAVMRRAAAPSPIVDRLIDLKSRFNAGDVDVAAMATLKREMDALEVESNDDAGSDDGVDAVGELSAPPRRGGGGTVSPRGRAKSGRRRGPLSEPTTAGASSASKLRTLRRTFSIANKDHNIATVGLRAETVDEAEQLQAALTAAGWHDLRLGAAAVYGALPHSAAESEVEGEVLFSGMLRQRDALNIKVFSDWRVAYVYADGRVTHRASTMSRTETSMAQLLVGGFGVMRAAPRDPTTLLCVTGDDIHAVVDACFADDKAAALNVLDRQGRGRPATEGGVMGRVARAPAPTPAQSSRVATSGELDDDSSSTSMPASEDEALADYFEDADELSERRLSLADFFEGENQAAAESSRRSPALLPPVIEESMDDEAALFAASMAEDAAMQVALDLAEKEQTEADQRLSSSEEEEEEEEEEDELLSVDAKGSAADAEAQRFASHLFAAIDKDKDAHVTHSELRKFCKRHRALKKQLMGKRFTWQAIFARIDTKRSNTFERDEFVRYIVERARILAIESGDRFEIPAGGFSVAVAGAPPARATKVGAASPLHADPSPRAYSDSVVEETLRKTSATVAALVSEVTSLTARVEAMSRAAEAKNDVIAKLQHELRGERHVTSSGIDFGDMYGDEHDDELYKMRRAVEDERDEDLRAVTWMAEADTNGDGVISRDEFLAWLEMDRARKEREEKLMNPHGKNRPPRSETPSPILHTDEFLEPETPQSVLREEHHQAVSLAHEMQARQVEQLERHLSAATKEAQVAMEGEAAAIHSLELKNGAMETMRRECVNALLKSRKALEYERQMRPVAATRRSERVASALETLGSALVLNHTAVDAIQLRIGDRK